MWLPSQSYAIRETLRRVGTMTLQVTILNVDAALLNHVPEFREASDAHIAEWGELIRYVLWGDLTLYAIRLYRESQAGDAQANATLTRLLAFIEECVQTSDNEVVTLAMFGFLENLHLMGDELIHFRLLLGQHSLKALQDIEGFWGGSRNMLNA
jgi:hypothetical protein